MSRWLVREINNVIKAAFPHKNTYDINERDMLTGHDMVSSLSSLDEVGWSKLLNDWIAGLAAAGYVSKDDMTVRSFDRWLARHAKKVAPQGAKKAGAAPASPPTKKAPPAEPIGNPIGEAMKEYHEASPKDKPAVLWSLCKTWGPSLIAMSFPDEVKQCLADNWSLPHRQRDIQDMVSIAARWGKVQPQVNWKDCFNGIPVDLNVAASPSRDYDQAYVRAFHKK